MNLLEAIIWVLVFVLFVVRGVFLLDPDFGWHIREGEIILKQGAIRADSLSYTMFGFPLVDTEWLTNALMAGLYGVFGMLGLSLLFSTLAILAELASLIGVYKDSRVRISFFLLLSSLLLPFLGARPQVITWLFWAVLARLLLDKDLWTRWKFLLPLGFLAWANLHGGYMAGLVAAVIFVVVKSLLDKGISKTDFLVLGLSAIGTLINPYGIRSWIEVFSQVLDSTARWGIMEWLPSIFFFSVPYVVLVAFGIALTIRYRRIFTLEQLFLFAFFLYLAVTSVRHLPLWGILCVAWVGIPIRELMRESAFFYEGKKRFRKVARYLCVFASIVLFFQLVNSFWEAKNMSEQRFYPVKALAYLASDLPSGGIMSDYGWGGYLDWKLPGKKVYIDGRMATWRWQSNPHAMSSHVFGEYLDLMKGKGDIKSVIAKYNIDTVLWGVPQDQNWFDQKVTFLFRLFTGRTEKENPKTFLESVRNLGWKEVYRDEVAVIYKKPGAEN